MKKALIEGATNNPGAPKGMTRDQVGTLPVKLVKYDDGNIACESAWKPSLEEVQTLIEGGYVVLRVLGWQVPVALWVVDEKGATEL